MILSRRQRESLLDEMSRMLANKQSVAFANHAKISERVSNNDLSFYINSPDKEFIIKYSNNEMKFNTKDKTFSELNALIFANKNKITGISDSSKNDSTIALSVKWAYNKDIETLKRMKKYNPEGISGSGIVEIIGITDENKYSQQHLLTYEYWKDHQEEQQEEDEKNYDERYAFKDHTHQEYADKNHVHNQYADKNHIHDQYADKVHSHPEYATQSQIMDLNFDLAGKAAINHSHDGLWSKGDIIDLIEHETKTPWYEKLFKGLEFVADVGQTGYLFLLQNQVNALYSAMAANGLIDAAQSATGLASLVQGIGSKFNAVANALDWVGQKFPKLSNVISKLTQPLRTVANHINGYTEIIDNVLDIGDNSGVTDLMETTAHHINHTGTIEDMMREELLPDVFETITKGKFGSADITKNGYMKFNPRGAS